MIGAAVHSFDVNVCTSTAGEALEEVSDQFGLQVADETGADFGVDSKSGAPAQVHGGDGESFVHGHQEVSGAQNAALVAEGAVKGFAQSDADVFDGVMLVYVQVAVALDFKIEGAVPGEQLQHVIEETDAGRDFILATAFYGEMNGNAGFRSITFNDGSTHSRFDSGFRFFDYCHCVFPFSVSEASFKTAMA